MARASWWKMPTPARTSPRSFSLHIQPSIDMAKTEGPVTIKKYANRRLYNTGTSTYVTLEDLATMAKTGEDITRSVLTQIIFEQENKEGAQNLLPIKFLRQLIGFYGGAMQKFVPSYLEVSLESFTREQEKFRQQISQAFGATPFGPIMEEQVRRNMEMFKQAFSMFTPFARHDEQGGGEAEKPAAAASSGSDLEELRKQLDDMRKKVDKLSDGEK